MPEHADYPGSTLRQLKVLVGVLIVSNLALGVLGFFVLRSVDRNYSALIAQAVPSLNALQTLTALETDAMRNTNPALFVGSEQNRGEAVTRARLTLERDRGLRNHALKRAGISWKTNERLSFEEAGEAFSQTATEVVNLLEAGDDAGAVRLREQSLRPAFDRYMARTTKIADVLEAESLQDSDKLTAQTGSMSHILLGLASWPVMVMGLFVAVAILFVMGVLLKVLIFRRAES